MNTEIEYLKQLEIDLKDAAARETTRMERATLNGAIRKYTGPGWTRVVGVAAAFLVVAGAIGFVFGGAGSSNSPATFDQAGEAVAGDGGQASRRAVGDATSGDPGFQPGVEPNAVPSPAPPLKALPGSSFGFESSGNLGDSTVRQTSLGRQQQDLSKIIRDGRIGIVVPDKKFGDAVGDLTFIAEKYGGFVISSSTNNDRSGTFVLRIPAKRFDRALGAIRDLATHVRFQEVRGDDVTAEFIDQQARLRILLARKALLFDLFQKATTTEEILRMSNQLDDVQLRIEQIQGQIKFINDQVAESTLRVSIQEQNAPKAATQTDVDNPDLGSSVDLAVQGFLRIVGAVIVGLGYLIPLTLLGVIVWFVVWTIRRSRAIS
jgi:hypothetical protein